VERLESSLILASQPDGVDDVEADVAHRPIPNLMSVPTAAK
jgi:hypothetical protein